MKKRVNVYYSGSVQGIGFRYTARSVGKKYAVSGWVKNLPDGRVEIVAEGEEGVLKDFLQDIREQMNYAHFKEDIGWSEPTGEFNGFEIRF